MRYLWISVLLLTGIVASAQTRVQTPVQLFERAKQELNPRTQIELLTQVIEQAPTYVDAYHYRADAYAKLGDNRQAIADYNQVVALRPKDPFRYYARGLAYSHQKEPQLALADFTRAIHLNPSHKNFYLARAREYRSIGRYNLALADYTKYVGDWEHASQVTLEEVIPISLDAYRYDIAQQQVDALAALGNDSASRHFWQGRIFQSDGKLDEAVSAFSKAINRKENWALAYQWRGATYRDMGDFEAALEDYNRVIELEPEAYWFNRRGLVYEEQKRFDKAVADYTRAIELSPKWAVAYNNRGFARMNLKQWEKAKADFETAIRLDPSAPTPYVNLAGTYWTFKKDRKNMYANLQKAIKHNFKNYEALFDDNQKGWMFKSINQTEEFRTLLYK